MVIYDSSTWQDLNLASLTVLAEQAAENPARKDTSAHSQALSVEQTGIWALLRQAMVGDADMKGGAVLHKRSGCRLRVRGQFHPLKT